MNWKNRWKELAIDNFKTLAERLVLFNYFTGHAGFEKEPSIVVFRNTDKAGNEVKDNGMNNCDIILLLDDELRVLTGRSFANKKYQQRQIDSKGRYGANKIASSYVKNAYRKGTHFGYQALRQNVSFPIIRSVDLVFGDEDDYYQYNIVADNFHGWAPASAGCITVEGRMQLPETGDWKIAKEWIYGKHKNTDSFSAIVFERGDFENPNHCLRYGSSGDIVRQYQQHLKSMSYDVDVDGKFGFRTLTATRQIEKKMGIDIDKCDGIADEKILKYVFDNIK